MKVTYYPKKIDQKASILVLGSFETIHNGHLKLIKLAKSFKKPVHLMMLKNAHQKLVAKNRIYESLEIRLQKIANLGVDKATIIPFNDEIKNMRGQDFIANLVSLTNATKLVMGEDFACGNKRLYKAKQIAQDYPSLIVEHEKINNTKISTSILKEMVLLGEVDVIKKIAPFPFAINSTVEKNKQFLISDLHPHPGIYIISAIVNEIEYWGYARIGFDKINTLDLIGLKNTDKAYLAQIFFHQLSRIIISTSNDHISKEDKKRIYQYLNA